MLQFLGAIGAIILVDLALSGDNALIIGAAASGLEPRLRRLAILAGGGAAIVLRILLAVAATFLLGIPLLEAIGGLILVVIAVRLLLDRSKEIAEVQTKSDATADGSKAKGTTFVSALLTILVADVTMSLDNILAVGGLAQGNIWALVIGLLFSVAILLVGSAIVAGLIGRLPWLLDVAAMVLGWTAGSMIYHDTIVGAHGYLGGLIGPWIDHLTIGSVSLTNYVVPAIGALIVLLIDIAISVWTARTHPKSAPTQEVVLGERIESR